MFTPENKINQAELSLYNAKLYLRNNEVDKAYSALAELVRLHGDFGRAWYELGMLVLEIFENTENVRSRLCIMLCDSFASAHIPIELIGNIRGTYIRTLAAAVTLVFIDISWMAANGRFKVARFTIEIMKF